MRSSHANEGLANAFCYSHGIETLRESLAIADRVTTPSPQRLCDCDIIINYSYVESLMNL